MVKFILTFFFLLIISNSANGMEISGIPKIIDGDTVHINEYKIRLKGIDAPEMKQLCKKNYFKFSSVIGFSFQKNYSCGITAKIKLENKIKNSLIRCVSSSRDRYKRYLATCYKDGVNLNKWMVKNGYAVSYTRYSKQYLIDENFAKDNKLGMWKGTFLRPEKWRKLN